MSTITMIMTKNRSNDENYISYLLMVQQTTIVAKINKSNGHLYLRNRMLCVSALLELLINQDHPTKIDNVTWINNEMLIRINFPLRLGIIRRENSL